MTESVSAERFRGDHHAQPMRRRLNGLSLCAVVLFVSGAEPAAILAQPTWPQFRGPRGGGVAEEQGVPVEFGPDTNVRWKTPLPPGHSSPVIWDDRIFLTAISSKGGTQRLETLCLDRQVGKILWRNAAPAEQIMPRHQRNSPAAPTPAVDGHNVYVYFDSYGLLAYDFAGNQQWARPLPQPVLPWGVGCSPVLAGDLLILNQDQDLGSFLLAVDAHTGETKWTVQRPDFRRGFSTPLVLPEEGQVVVAGSLRIVGYDLSDGHEVWSVTGLPYQVSPSPVVSEGIIYFAGWDLAPPATIQFSTLLSSFDSDGDGTLSEAEYARHSFDQFSKYDRDKDGIVKREEFEGFQQFLGEAENALLAIRLGGRGDVTDTHVAWKASTSLPHIPSVLAYRGRIHTVNHGAVTVCYDAATGRQHYRSRLPGPGQYFASPVATDGKVYFASAKGVVTVIESSAAFNVLATNNFAEPILASPAIVDGTLYLRTGSHLYAIGE